MKRVLTRRDCLHGAAGLAATMMLGAPLRAAVGAHDLRILLQVIDERQRSHGAYRAGVYMEQRQEGRAPVVYEAQVYRRNRDQETMVLFDGPRSIRGQAYLRVRESLSFYEPHAGRWKRWSCSESIAGTSSRFSDFDGSRYALEYEPSYEGEAKIGAYTAQVLALRAKPSMNVAFPSLRLWFDRDSDHLLKQQDFAPSEKLVRTAYFPRWQKKFSDSKQADLWYPPEMRLYDELMRGRMTLVQVQEVDLGPIPTEYFTKAWIESKSR